MKVKAALAECPVVIVSEIYQHTDTLDCATIKLPALAWSETDGTVTNSKRHISRQRALYSPPAGLKPTGKSFVKRLTHWFYRS
ncbi:molybdopterin-dependent oxidoreductase [Alishewanella longhuensis]